jgi:lipopolysaccharide/colanic/teichoic acid biosynthesis glycosyltransferase
MTIETPCEPDAIPSSPRPPSPASIVAAPWRRRLLAVVVSADLVAGVLATLLALRLRFGTDLPDLYLRAHPVSYSAAGLVVACAWPGVLGSLGAYRSAVLGSGADEMGRVVEAGLTLFAALAATHLLLETSLSGLLVGIALGLLVLAGLVVRIVTSRVVQRGRRRHRWCRRVVVYGSDAESAALARHFARHPALGVDVVGACITDRAAASGNGDGDGWPTATSAVPGPGVESVVPGVISVTGVAAANGRVGDAAIEVLAATGASMLAVAGGTSPADVRALAWSLEGTAAELVIAPAVPDLAQQRVVVESVGGVPLLRVEQCRQRRGRLLVKGIMDRLGAAVLLVALAPVFGAVAVAIRRSSVGPVLYRQPRVGQHGVVFELLKFRTMVIGADAELAALMPVNEADGRLFRLADDPRVTSIGRFLRRHSLDELPQLWNVVKGDMSLVGPRPLIVQSDAYIGDERRRLRVKPGMTGLYQVSGRRDLGWAETVALDMHYVDHWSLGLDLVILARTPFTVVSGRGAY